MSENKVMTFIDPYEDVVLEDVQHAMDMGFVTLTEIKNFTRAGMGIDEGRMSVDLVVEELAKYYKVSAAKVMKPSFRPPLEPVSVGILADAHKKWLAEGGRD